MPVTHANSAAPSRDSAAMIDPRALMRINGLELRARAIVEGFMSGLHRSPYHGFSVEFTEYRQYTEGDDPRYIDWKLYARSDRLYVKRFEDETNLRCWLLVDNSKSMHYGSVGYTKAAYAATLAATLAYFLSKQRDAAGLVSFDEDIREYLPARYRPGHLRRLMIALERAPQGGGTKLTEPLKRIAELVSKRGLHVLISDLLAPLDGLETHLGYLRSRGHEVVVFHTLDPAEVSLDFKEPALFFDVETGKQLYVDPALIRRQYQQRIGDHIAAVRTICDRLGIDYHRVVTDQPLELALFDFLAARQQVKQPTMRRQRGGGGGGSLAGGASGSPPSQGGARGGSGTKSPLTSIAQRTSENSTRSTLPQPLPKREGSEGSGPSTVSAAAAGRPA